MLAGMTKKLLGYSLIVSSLALANENVNLDPVSVRPVLVKAWGYLEYQFPKSNEIADLTFTIQDIRHGFATIDLNFSSGKVFTIEPGIKLEIEKLGPQTFKLQTLFPDRDPNVEVTITGNTIASLVYNGKSWNFSAENDAPELIYQLKPHDEISEDDITHTLGKFTAFVGKNLIPWEFNFSPDGKGKAYGDGTVEEVAFYEHPVTRNLIIQNIRGDEAKNKIYLEKDHVKSAQEAEEKDMMNAWEGNINGEKIVIFRPDWVLYREAVAIDANRLTKEFQKVIAALHEFGSAQYNKAKKYVSETPFIYITVSSESPTDLSLEIPSYDGKPVRENMKGLESWLAMDLKLKRVLQEELNKVRVEGAGSIDITLRKLKPGTYSTEVTINKESYTTRLKPNPSQVRQWGKL